MVNKNDLIELLKKYDFTEEQINRITESKTLLKLGKEEKLEKNLEVLVYNHISLEKISRCTAVFLKNDYLEIEKIFKVLENHNISKETIENCLSVLARGKAKEIEEIFKALDEHNISKETIENCLSVLAMGKAKEIEEIFKVLDEHNISKETIENCISVLANGKAKEIEEMFKVLDEHNISRKTIENCLYVLASGKAKEIEEIFKVLENHNISKENIGNCLSVLARGKAKEIEKIFKVLENHNISKETIENCLTVLAKGKAKEIEEMFKVLDEHNVSKENIEENYGRIFIKNLNEVNKIFSGLPEDIDTENIIMYMKLKGYYNKIVTKEEINKICEFKNINIEKIITLYLKQRNIADYKKILEEKDGLYIGKSIPMNKQDMNKYGNIILDISKKISNLISFRYKYDKQDLESFCVSILIEKCGDVVYNTDINQEFMYRALYNKTKKYCIGYILKQKDNYNVDFSKLQNTTKTSVYDKNSFEKDELDVKQWNLKSKDEEIIKILSNYLEMGYDNKNAFKNTARDLDLDIEELIYNIEEIKNQILNESKDSDEQKKEERE